MHMPTTPTATMQLEQTGLARILKNNRLQVPANQRNYAWEDAQVTQLLEDLNRAQHDRESYFLGTVVTIARENNVLEVVDGQQRLATTTLLLVAVRDYLRKFAAEEMLVKSIEGDFLTIIDRKKREIVPRIRLNVEDNEFFAALLAREDGAPLPEPQRSSHERLRAAYNLASRHVEAIVAGAGEADHGNFLNDWVTFLDEEAMVVLLKVHDDANAYRMFETLNDRGLKTSQADLVKNHLFGAAGDRIQEVQQRWAYMRGALEALEEEDVTIDFLRYAVIAMTGYKREADLYNTVKGLSKSEQQALSFASRLDELASVYAAALSSDNAKWNSYPASARKALQVLNLLDIRPMRALVLSVAARLSPSEAAKALRLLASAGVRLLIASSTRSASVEMPLAETARKVFTEEVTTAAGIREQLASIIPGDSAFSEAMRVVKVANARLSRYLLRSLELAASNEGEPYFIPNDDGEVINLEHVLPKRPDGNWADWSDDDRRKYVSRLGNQALMRASDNSHIKSSDFSEKRPSLAQSPYSLTSQIAGEEDWLPAQIEARQARLADLAPKAWPV
jgi:uncharacterized protein with ParB-like and HNH nuclease domain